MTKNIVFRKHYGEESWQDIHPKTNTTQVIRESDGKNLEEVIRGLERSDIGEGAFNDIAYIATGSLSTAIANTPNGGRLLLKNGGTYTINSEIVVSKDIIIDGNNATIIGLGSAKLTFTGNVEIYNTTFERASITLRNTDKKAKIVNNKFKSTYDNLIDCTVSLKSLVVTDNESDGTIVSTDYTFKNLNNSGSFLYANGGTIDFLRVQRNRILNNRGGTVLFFSGAYSDLEISDNTLDTMAQRGVGFWDATDAKGVIARNRILKCGVLKASGVDAGIGCNAIYSNGVGAGLEVLDNYIEYVYENGIEGNFRSIKRNTIIGTGMDLVNYPTPSYEGIFFNGGNMEITDNTLINCMGNGIYTYTETVDFNKISIMRNRIVNDVYREYTAICFRSPSNVNVKDIQISDNYIENYSDIIEIPNGKVYTNVKIGKQTAVNYETMLNYFVGSGIDCEGMTNNRTNLIKNGNFNIWDASTNRFTDWALNNATLSLVTDNIKNTARVTASDVYKGRITQTTAGVANPSAIENRYCQLVLRVRGNNNLLIRYYTIDASGSAGSPIGIVVNGLSATDFKIFKVRLPYRPAFRLEICNDGIAGNWIEVSEANMYLLDLV